MEANGTSPVASDDQVKRPGPPRVPGSVINHAELPAATQLVVRAQTGGAVAEMEADALAAFDLYASRLNGFARAAVRDPDIAEDLVQETFLRLVQELRVGRRPDDFGGWLFRVCGNLIVSRGRRTSVANRMASLLVDRRLAPSPEEEALRHDRDRLLAEALARLPADARVALLLAAKGFGATDIGTVIHRSQAATRTYICRSRLRLRDILAEMGVDGRS